MTLVFAHLSNTKIMIQYCRNIFPLVTSLMITSAVMAQHSNEYKLWPSGVPDSNGLVSPERNDSGRISNVTDPTITVYLPKGQAKPSPAVVICPGGGYARLASEHEGHAFARWLNSLGIAGIVLKYRLPNQHTFVPLEDVQQAIRTVRSSAAEWNINPEKVGVAGFSAGGHLAGTASVLYDQQPLKEARYYQISARPDFSILVYPVISMEDSIVHKGSRRNLLGDNPSPELLELFSLEKQVNAKTPPTILFHSEDDKTVPIENSRQYYQSLLKNGVHAMMLELPAGGHGWGMRQNGITYDPWLSTLKTWLNTVLTK